MSNIRPKLEFCLLSGRFDFKPKEGWVCFDDLHHLTLYQSYNDIEAEYAKSLKS